MSTSKKIVNEALESEDDHELPPVVTRTRSGRKVRTPAAYCEVTKTPTRRTRKSVIQQLPSETEPELKVVDLDLVPDKASEKELRITESESNVLRITESESNVLATIPTCAGSVQKVTETPAEKSSGTDKSAEAHHCNNNENKLVSVPMETVPNLPNKTGKKRTHSESNEKKQRLIPLGKPKSGRVWKDRNKQRFSAVVRDKILCTSWEKKMEAKREKELLKKYSQQLKEDKAREKEEKRKRREENLKRRAENERKAEVVQVIRNTSKIKRMKKKHLRKIEKRDTLVMLQKSQPKNPQNPKAARKGGKVDK